jgi:hypothetical protein
MGRGAADVRPVFIIPAIMTGAEKLLLLREIGYIAIQMRTHTYKSEVSPIIVLFKDTRFAPPGKTLYRSGSHSFKIYERENDLLRFPVWRNDEFDDRVDKSGQQS